MGYCFRLLVISVGILCSPIFQSTAQGQRVDPPGPTTVPSDPVKELFQNPTPLAPPVLLPGKNVPDIQFAPPVLAPNIPVAPAVRPIPVVAPARGRQRLNFDMLARAKIAMKDDHAKVIVMLDSMRAIKQRVKVTEMKVETRTENVVEGGEQKEQSVPVEVPVTYESEIVFTEPAGTKPFAVDAKTMRFFRLDGTEVEVSDAATVLAKLQPVFLLDNFRGEPKPLSPIARESLKPDCLILVTDEPLRQNAANPR